MALLCPGGMVASALRPGSVQWPRSTMGGYTLRGPPPIRVTSSQGTPESWWGWIYLTRASLWEQYTRKAGGDTLEDIPSARQLDHDVSCQRQLFLTT